MKLFGYLLSLSLAVAVAAPASAESIYFTQSYVVNKTDSDLVLESVGIDIRAHDVVFVKDKKVDWVQGAEWGDRYYPTRGMNVRELAQCYFDDLVFDHSVNLTCIGGVQAQKQTVVFKSRKGRSPAGGRRHRS